MGQGGEPVKLEETASSTKWSRSCSSAGQPLWLVAAWRRGLVATTAVHRVTQGPRSRVFQLQEQLLADERGAGGCGERIREDEQPGSRPSGARSAPLAASVSLARETPCC
ncbi:hypothetical protein BRADI_2g26225v3 [Brachypodium distachyon]|uniref:Uncharacterized protein n=1 Tax=Brachypodium distachyon TaxID=15368 RepID=A0A2K2DAK9_BRADI|nr:hypothetical protein BRADI_2g26225v3 [Brachypodium distachyon]